MKRSITEYQKEFRIIGLSRSGNHAVINWIINQLEGKYCFLNCTEPKHNPFHTARPLKKEGKVFRTNIANFDLEQEQAGVFSNKDYLLYNHEDIFLGSLNKKEVRKQNKEWIGSSDSIRDILILRDPFNLFASRIKAGLIKGHFTHHGTRPISINTLQRIYKQHAREFLNEKKYLKNKVLINFNRWNKQADYRMKIAEELGLAFSDEGFLEVASVAGGSSFDGTNFSGRATEMDLNNRWKKFTEDEEYWTLFDSEIVELSRRIFGEIPAIGFLEQQNGTVVKS